MKNRKVLRVAFHIGVQFNQSVKSSLDSVKNDVEMIATSVGVLCSQKNGTELLVPYANCHWISLEAETP